MLKIIKRVVDYIKIEKLITAISIAYKFPYRLC